MESTCNSKRAIRQGSPDRTQHTEVSELGLAGALWTIGVAPKATHNFDGRITWFYESTPCVAAAIRDYHAGVLKLSARQYNRAIREFQTELRDLRARTGR